MLGYLFGGYLQVLLNRFAHVLLRYLSVKILVEQTESIRRGHLLQSHKFSDPLDSFLLPAEVVLYFSCLPWDLRRNLDV
jgi:hypothetical protein